MGDLSCALLRERFGLQERHAHLSAFISGFPVPELLASRRWRPKVALLKQSLLVSVHSVRTLRIEIPKKHLDQTLGDPQGNCTR